MRVSCVAGFSSAATKMQKLLLLVLLVLPAVLFTVNGGNKFVAFAQDDDEELVDVEEADTAVKDEGPTEGEDETGLKASPDADTTILFVNPVTVPGAPLDLPAGKIAEFVIGFHNKGKQDMVLEMLDASFRYAMDYNFYMQNFSTITYQQTVKPAQEASIMYSFIPAESFAGRPFGFTVNLHYKDANGLVFREAVFNETVNVIEIEEGLDGETFFLYVFLAACVVLLLVVGQQFLYSVGRSSRGGRSRKAFETGTDNKNDVDYDWLPQETLNSIKNSSPKTPKLSPRSQKQSPKLRKTKRSAGED